MVVFTCNHCGDSLQKPKVEKHYNFVCRTVKSLTCVDCFKDFKGEEYAVHTKCITEEERYAAKGSIPNGIIKKGEVKQESWMDMIKSIIEQEINLKASVKRLFETISQCNNVPRKKSKFLNFIKSSSAGRVNMQDVEEVWGIIEKYKNNKVQKEENRSHITETLVDKEGDNNQENGQVSATDGKKSKKKKQNNDELDYSNNIKKQKLVEGSEECNNNPDDLNSKKSKKKKRSAKNLDEVVVENGQEVQEHNPIKPKKKKKVKNEVDEDSIEKQDILEIGNNEDGETQKKSKKKKESTEETANQKYIENCENKEEKLNIVATSEADNSDQIQEFNFAENILNILQSKNCIPLKKLEKKILKLYLKYSGDSETSPKTVKKFHKTLRKLTIVDDVAVSVVDDVVSLTK